MDYAIGKIKLIARGDNSSISDYDIEEIETLKKANENKLMRIIGVSHLA